MRRAIAIAAATVAALVLAAAAAATIVPQRGMAGVRLGMTRAQVRAELGAPLRTIRGTNDFGPYTELRYRGPLRLTFQGNRGLTAISTSGKRERTASGVGVGSTEAALRRGVPGVRCQTESGFRHCFLGAFTAGHRVTDFRITRGRVTRIVVGFVID